MTANETYFELAAAGTFTLPADSAGRQIEVLDMMVTADVAGSLTLADNNSKPTSRKIFVAPGVNDLCEWAMNFIPGKAVTFTAATAALTVFVRYVYK